MPGGQDAILRSIHTPFLLSCLGTFGDGHCMRYHKDFIISLYGIISVMYYEHFITGHEHLIMMATCVEPSPPPVFATWGWLSWALSIPFPC